MLLYSRKLVDFLIYRTFKTTNTLISMFKFGISAHNIKFQKPNFSYRSSERVIHNEILFAAFVRNLYYNLNMNEFMVLTGILLKMEANGAKGLTPINLKTMYYEVSLWHGSDIPSLRQNFVVGHKMWIFVNRILCWIQKAAKKEGPQ